MDGSPSLLVWLLVWAVRSLKTKPTTLWAGCAPWRCKLKAGMDYTNSVAWWRDTRGAGVTGLSSGDRGVYCQQAIFRSQGHLREDGEF